VYRRAYVLLVGVAAAMGATAFVVAWAVGEKVVDPDGFLGPSWLRLPLLVSLAFLLDLVPRAVLEAKGDPRAIPVSMRARLRTHWGRERLTLVLLGLASFYVTYVSYRNIKSFLPSVMGHRKYDYELHLVDRALLFGHDPALLLHHTLGTHLAAYGLSTIYLWFLPLVPLALICWLTWSTNITYGYWFATSQVLAWTLGTISYYALPTLGPGFAYPWLYSDLAPTSAQSLMSGLYNARQSVIWPASIEGSVQSVAGFASLHSAITLLVAMMIQYTIRNRILRLVFWVNFALTLVATLYFGWHYIADDIAGILIALLSFYIGGIASGQKFERHGRASHPTTTTSAVPVDADV
jgi:hypothetical protein